MRQTRAGKSAPGPSYLAPKPDPIILARDFDDTEGATQQAVEWVGKGHVLEVDVPRNS